MVLFSLLLCIGCFYLAHAIGDRRERIDFEQRNSFGNKEYRNWNEAKQDRFDDGVSRLLSNICALIVCVSGLFFIIAIYAQSQF